MYRIYLAGDLFADIVIHTVLFVCSGDVLRLLCVYRRTEEESVLTLRRRICRRRANWQWPV